MVYTTLVLFLELCRLAPGWCLDDDWEDLPRNLEDLPSFRWQFRSFFCRSIFQSFVDWYLMMYICIYIYEIHLKTSFNSSSSHPSIHMVPCFVFPPYLGWFKEKKTCAYTGIPHLNGDFSEQDVLKHEIWQGPFNFQICSSFSLKPIKTCPLNQTKPYFQTKKNKNNQDLNSPFIVDVL